MQTATIIVLGSNREDCQRNKPPTAATVLAGPLGKGYRIKAVMCLKTPITKAKQEAVA